MSEVLAKSISAYREACMEQISIGDILDQTVKRKATTAEMYTVRTGRKVLRNGQSASVYDRLEAHLGLDWRAEQKS